MNAKEYLLQISITNAHLKAVEANIEKIRKELYILDDISLSSTWGDGQPHSTLLGDPTGTKAAKLADSYNAKRQQLKKQLLKYEHQQIQLRAELWAKRIQIIETIEGVFDPSNAITSVYHRILTLRYVEGVRWEQIAVDIGYTIRHTWRLHGEALKKVEELIKC